MSEGAGQSFTQPPTKQHLATKQRDGMMPETLFVQLENDSTKDRLTWHYESATNNRILRIEEGLEAKEWINQQEIAEDLEVDPGTISRDIKKAILHRRGKWTRAWFKERLTQAKRERDSLNTLLKEPQKREDDDLEDGAMDF